MKRVWCLLPVWSLDSSLEFDQEKIFRLMVLSLTARAPQMNPCLPVNQWRLHLVQGSRVSAGTLNIDGSLLVEAASVGEKTRLAAIRRLVNEAQNSKPPVARIVDQITSVFVPVIILIAGMTFLAWWLVGPEPQLSFAFVTTMSVLIIACPCALGLAVPMSIMVGIGRAATSGVLVRNSEVLQIASTLDIIVLDKTGTLTKGEPEVSTIDGLNSQ